MLNRVAFLFCKFVSKKNEPLNQQLLRSLTIAVPVNIGTVGYASGEKRSRCIGGALQADEMSARFPHELLCANDNKVWRERG
jgi:hypothetical protein